MLLNWQVYKTLNPDLKFNTRIEYERHYLEYGKRERRRVSVYNLYPDFDYKQYQSNYIDFYYYSKNDLELHWITNGIAEKRTYKKVLKWIYIINSIKSGGTTKYISDLVKYYGINIRLVRTKNELTKYNFNSSDIIFVQQLTFTDITPDDLIHIRTTKRTNMFIILHDFGYLNRNIYTTGNNVHNKGYLNPKNEVIPSVHILFKLVNNVICPSDFVVQQYTKFINSDKYIVVNHTDYRCDSNRIIVPKVTTSINIGVFHEISEIKGSEYVSYLMKTYKMFNGVRINYFVVGFNIDSYKEDEFFKILTKYNIHGLLLLNKYAETWCYLLTKYLFSGISILYNNIGAFKERITPLENRFSVGEIDGMIDISKLNKGFEDMLNYIAIHGKLGKRVWTEGVELNKPEFYLHLFR
jgi:hypothetical protein